jgi:5-methylcytosine-specific restriction endonuclease McrA
MKLKTLKTRLGQVQAARLPVLSARNHGVERKRGSAGVKDRANIKKRDFGLCQECRRQGLSRPGHEVDHIVPLWAGGTDEPSNKETLCRQHHQEKTAREAGERAAGGYL